MKVIVTQLRKEIILFIFIFFDIASLFIHIQDSSVMEYFLVCSLSCRWLQRAVGSIAVFKPSLIQALGEII